MADLARIKRNVAKMAGMNAPEADIDAYIASEGVTVDDVRAFKPVAQQPTLGQDDITAMREALMKASDTGDLAEEKRLSAALKQVDIPQEDWGNVTFKPVSPDSMYQPGLPPVDQATAFLTSAVNQVPVAGPLLEKGIASVQASAHNAFKPTDYPITPEDVIQTNRQREAVNYKGAFAGKIAGNASPFLLASKLALPAKLLGLEGPLLSRLGFGTASQYAINTGDKMTREGDSLPKAAVDAIAPTLLTAPLSLFGSPTRAGRVVTAELQRVGIGADDVQAALAEIGPAAVIGDLSPRLQGRVGAVATMPGPGQDLIVNALKERAAQANSRIKGSVEETLGPAPIPSREAAAIKANQDALGPQYGALFQNARAVDTASLANDIDTAVVNLRGEAQAALKKVRPMLDIHGVPGTLDPNPSTLFQTRQAIDGMLATEANPKAVAALTQVRQQVDALLAQSVPGLKELDAKFAELARQGEGLDYGKTVLRDGDAPLHPEEFADTFKAGAEPQGQFVGPSGVPVRIRQGIGADIARIVGTKANDRVALKQILKGDGSWNREKLVTAFGQENADRLIKLFEGEARMAETEALAFGNSKTEMIRSAKSGIEPSSREGVIKALLNAKLGDAAWNAADRVTGGVASAERSKTNEAIARALLERSVSQGGPRITGKQFSAAIARALIAAGAGQQP